MRAKVSLFLVFLTMILSFAVDPATGTQKAPDFTLVDIDGNPFTLSNCVANVVLIDFFATWCGPCKAAIPTLKTLYDEYSRSQLEIISISSESEVTLRNFARQQNMEWIIARDTAGVVDDYYEGWVYRPIPRTLLIDADGYIRYDHTGWSGSGDEMELRSKISSLLSGTENGNSDTGQTEPPYTLIVLIGGVVIILLVASIVYARQLQGSAGPPKKRGSQEGRG